MKDVSGTVGLHTPTITSSLLTRALKQTGVLLRGFISVNTRSRQPLQVHHLPMQQGLGYGPLGGMTQVVGGTPGVTTTIIVANTQLPVGVGPGTTPAADTRDKRWRQQTTVPVETRTGCCGLLTACTLISLCNSVVTFMISGESQLFAWVFEQIGIADQVKKDLTDWGDHQDQIQLSFTCTRILSVLLAAFVLLKFEYRMVAWVSSTVLGLSVLITSFLDISAIALIGILIGGVAGVASGFLYMCAILPVLEHFDDGIFRALHAVHQGETVGYVVCALMRMATGNSWRSLFRWQLLVMAFAFGSGFALTSAEFHDSSLLIRNSNEPAKTKRKLTWNIFNHPAIYLLMMCFLFQRLGFGYLHEQAGTLLDGAVYLVLFYLAQWLGPIVMFSKRCVTGYLPHTILVAFSLVAGVYTLAVPKVEHSDGLILLFIVIVGVAVATTESLRDVILTAQFLKEQYCLAFGVLYTCTGIGEIIVAATGEKEEADVLDDNHHLDFFILNLSGSFIIVSAAFVLAAAVVYNKLGFPLKDCLASCNISSRFSRLRDEDDSTDGDGLVQEEVLPITDPEDISYGTSEQASVIRSDALQEQEMTQPI